MSSPVTKPFGMAFVLIFFLLTLLVARAEEAREISLSLDDPTNERDINIDAFEEKKYKLELSAEEQVQLLVEFVPDPPGESGFSRDSENREQGPPDLILGLVEGNDEPLFVTDGENEQVNPDDDKYNQYKCSKVFPCFKRSESHISVDDDTFFSLEQRAFVNHSTNGREPIYITVMNYDRCSGGEESTCVKPKLSGKLRITLAPKNEPRCPGFVPEEGSVCGGNGKCDQGQCKCNDEFIGRFCTEKLYTMESLPTPPEKPSSGWLHSEFDVENAAIVEIEPFTALSVNWTKRPTESRFFIEGIILAGKNKQKDSDPEVSFGTGLYRPHWTRKKDDPRVFPSTFARPLSESCRYGHTRAGIYAFTCGVREIEKSEEVRLMLYADSRLATDDSLRPVVVNFRFQPCGADGQPECPIDSAISIPAAVLPVSIATVAITGMAIMIMLWLDRRHGFTRAVDRLSQKELERMYPTKKFHSSMLEDYETTECLVCINEFEQGDKVRTLHCNHVFHNECLDPWVIQSNASCPACRAELRIQDLSDRKRLRRVIRFFLAPIVWIRSRRIRRSAEGEATVLPQEDAEGGTDLESGLQQGEASNALQNVAGDSQSQRAASSNREA